MNSRTRSRIGLMFLGFALVAVLAVAACGDDEVAAPVVIEKEVIKEVEVPVVVEKEVIKEVIKEVVVVKEVEVAHKPKAKPAKVFAWRMPTSSSATDPYVLGMLKFTDRVRERSNGAVDITMFPANTLLNPFDAPKELIRGTVEIDGGQIPFYAGIFPLLAVLQPSFVGVTGNDVYELLLPGTEGSKIINAVFAEQGLRVLTWWNQADVGYGSFDPLATPEDFKGKKVRTSTPTNNAVLKALNAEPTTLSGSEAVDAMRRGIIEASTIQPTGAFSRGYVDFAKWYNPWVAIPLLAFIAVNVDAFNSLPADLQAIVEEEAAAAGQANNAQTATIQGAALLKMITTTGMSALALDPREKARMRAISEPVTRKFVADAKPQPQATQLFELLLAQAESK